MQRTGSSLSIPFKQIIMPTIKTPTIKKEILVLDQKVNTLEIKTVDDMPKATEMLSIFNKNLKSIKDEKEKMTKPIMEALNVERARWKPMELILEAGVKKIRDAMSVFQTAEKKREDDEALAIAKRVGEGKGHIKVETAVKKINEIEKVQESHTTAQGSVSFRTDKILKVTDITKIPAKYFDLNESRLLADLKAGVIVEGAEVELKQTPINRKA